MHAAEHEARNILRAARADGADVMTLAEAGDRILAMAARIRYQRAYRDGYQAARQETEEAANAAAGRLAAIVADSAVL